MDTLKSKSLKNIEQRMEGLDVNSLRYQVLESARNFKTSWVALGRALYSVFSDKLYKEWGYGTFEAYASREIGIRKQTAMKLLRSYYFLEKEEPDYLRHGYTDPQDAALIPGHESIEVLRLAKNKKTLDSQDYARLKKKIFEEGRDAREVRKDLTALIRERQELEPEEARQKRKLAAVKRFLGTLKALKKELETGRFLSATLIKEASSLINKLEAELS